MTFCYKVEVPLHSCLYPCKFELSIICNFSLETFHTHIHINTSDLLTMYNRFVCSIKNKNYCCVSGELQGNVLHGNVNRWGVREDPVERSNHKMMSIDVKLCLQGNDFKKSISSAFGDLRHDKFNTTPTLQIL